MLRRDIFMGSLLTFAFPFSGKANARWGSKETQNGRETRCSVFFL
jgi:hypothetical protein